MASILGRTYGQVNTPGRARETCLPGAWLADSSFILVLDSWMEGDTPPPPPLKMQVWQGKELLRKSAQFVRSWSALWAKEWEIK